MQFTVDIDIDSAAVNNIRLARQCVTVMRAVTAFVQSDAPSAQSPPIPAFPVAWLAFPPMETNTLVWSPLTRVFASQVLPSPQAVISVNAQTPYLNPRATATLKNGSFTLGSPSSVSAGFLVSNQAEDLVYVGLMAGASVNGHTRPDAPMSIQPVLRNQTADLGLDSGTITIFLSTIGADGSLLPSEDFSDSGLVVSLNGANATAQVGFKDDTSTFFRM
jgi:hypothetical protein